MLLVFQVIMNYLTRIILIIQIVNNKNIIVNKDYQTKQLTSNFAKSYMKREK